MLTKSTNSGEKLASEEKDGDDDDDEDEEDDDDDVSLGGSPSITWGVS